MSNATWTSFFRSFLYYHTVKVVQIRSWKLGVLHYGIMAAILFYVGFYAIYWSKGYQIFGDLIGNVAVKVKGNGYHIEPNGNVTVWDTYDIVYPAQESNALFVTTNFLSTPQQHRSICNGTDPATESCNDGSQCSPFRDTLNGIDTGNCGVNGFCDLYAWCPLEDGSEELPDNIIQGVNNFTVFIRVTAKFPKFNVIVDNANGTKNSSAPLAPNNFNVWLLDTILQDTQFTYEQYAVQGGVVAVSFKFDCNFDFDPSRCVPSIAFDRIDVPKINGGAPLGYNFRYASYYWLAAADGQLVEYRDLLKVFGIRFIFLVSGQAGKFDFVPLLINIGSGLALLSIATLISDFITLYVLPDRKFYNTVKYDNIEAHEIERWAEEQRKKKQAGASHSGDVEPDDVVLNPEQLQQRSAPERERTPLIDSTRF
eukprot:TRINITY_DN11237_c0_g1_i2.p1 TRINITY_DN11237_c0_g1~~TRINITY_DN11237_c0_g1_i2.p1  ORF type:complete len:425 (-),score=130.85 TRINITY_DN11237_c0_g1_i2:222-1496(-)